MAELDADVPILADAVFSETGEHTAQLLVPRRPGPRAQERSYPPQPESSQPPTHSPTAIAAMERDIAELAARWGGVEQHLDRNAAAIGALGEQLAATQQALNASNSAQQQLIAQLAQREDRLDATRKTLDDSNIVRQELLGELALKDKRIVELSEALEQNEAARTEDARIRANLEAQRRERDDSRQTLAVQLAQSESRVAELEQALAASDAHRQSVETELGKRDSELEDARNAATQNLAAIKTLEADLEDRGRALAALHDERDESRQSVASLQAELSAVQTQSQDLQKQLELEQSRRETMLDAAAQPASDVDAYRTEIAALSAYIDNRRSEWDRLHAELAEHRSTIAELNAELTQRTERQLQQERTMQQEARRATQLGEQLAALNSTVTQLKSELAERRLDANSRRAEAESRQVAAGAQAAAQVAEEFKAEIGRLRDELSEQSALLRARETELAASQQAQRELLQDVESEQASEAESNRSRTDLKQLERDLANPDLPSNEKERIATLQRELSERIQALRVLQTAEPGGDVVAIHAGRGELAAPPPERRATLVCLTNDHPEAYRIDKSEMIIGRSSDCDIQILTHFVSREHAGLQREDERVFIEDLGSTNGVFVNAVRVERQQLQHGDWVTIGETQFRFLDEA
jgi:chromosome segregation ATPase